MKVQTVNIVEQTDYDVISIRAFDESGVGNQEAKALFSKVAIENGANPEDMESYLDDGCYVDGSYSVFLVHSD